VGEYLALTGVQMGADEAIAYGLADVKVTAESLASVWNALATQLADAVAGIDFSARKAIKIIAAQAVNMPATGLINTVFSLPTVTHIMAALDAANEPWAQQTAATLRTRSPLMLHVVLEQIRRGRQLDLAQNLQMERDMVRHCFYTAHLGRFGNASETVEGIRALAVDKDHQPSWNPPQISDVTNDMVSPFFVSPWPVYAHPLAQLTQITQLTQFTQQGA
jgi:enoyl-CoA hydratase